MVTFVLIILWWGLSLWVFYSCLKSHHHQAILQGLHLSALVIVIGGFFLLHPSNKRDWKPEVDRLAQFRFSNGKVEIENVRNFIWKDADDYEIQWETRQYDLDDLEQLDLILSHFVAGPVAHVFISFGFKDGEHLAFSLEVRQEKHEDFSVIGGFFRQYELALVVGDENDLVYTRSNIRDEKVYVYPIQMNKTELQMLFVEYLSKANRLRHQPKWYNTLTSNCTTILFDLAEHATGQIPRDYRVLLPGLLPEYLYEHQQLDSTLSLDEWRERAYINHKTENLHQGPEQDGINFSRLIREPD